MSERLIAHLAHVELLTPDPEGSLRFFREVIGLEESGRAGQSVFLRGWGEWSRHSLELTEAPRSGIGHVGWRTASPAALDTAVRRLDAATVGRGWLEESPGHGRAYRFEGPGGHTAEVFWEIERYEAPPELRSPFPNRPQRYAPRGIAPRQIDHVTVMTPDPFAAAEWYRDVLGFTFTEWTVLDHDEDVTVFAMVTSNEKSHDYGLLLEQGGTPGRLHHLAWWVDSTDQLLRAAEILLNADVPIEFGPGRHGMGEQDYLYFREPSGNRIEVNTGGYRLYEPDWKPVKWTPAMGSNTLYKNVPLVESMLEATPPDAADESPELNPWAAPGVR